nr:hypothetical protein [uncultured bacterium]
MGDAPDGLGHRGAAPASGRIPVSARRAQPWTKKKPAMEAGLNRSACAELLSDRAATHGCAQAQQAEAQQRQRTWFWHGVAVEVDVADCLVDRHQVAIAGDALRRVVERIECDTVERNRGGEEAAALVGGALGGQCSQGAGCRRALHGRGASTGADAEVFDRVEERAAQGVDTGHAGDDRAYAQQDVGVAAVDIARFGAGGGIGVDEGVAGRWAADVGVEFKVELGHDAIAARGIRGARHNHVGQVEGGKQLIVDQQAADGREHWGAVHGEAAELDPAVAGVGGADGVQQLRRGAGHLVGIERWQGHADGGWVDGEDRRGWSGCCGSRGAEGKCACGDGQQGLLKVK